MVKTKVLHPLPEDFEEKELKKSEKVFKKIQEHLQREETLTLTCQDFLARLKISHNQYITAIRSSLQKPQVFIKRDIQDIFISPFSKKILDLMRSNQNIQFVFDAYGAACYIIDYINKSNRGMSELMKNVLKEIREGNDKLQESLRKISNTFHKNSELSIQEACYNILQLPLSKSSEECIFIPTFPKQDRVRLVKSQETLEKLNENSTDIFEQGLIQHYCNRPRDLELLSLAEFSADYRFSNKSGPNSIPLLNSSGFIFKRTKSRVIRFRNYHYEMDPEIFIREHIMLYFHWRDEDNDILHADMESLFLTNETTIKNVKKKFHSLEDHVLNVAMQEATQRTENLDSTENDSTRPVFDFDTFSMDNDPFCHTDIQTEFQDDKPNSVTFTSPKKLDENEFQNLFEMLNQDQRNYVMHVANHFENSKKQLLHFFTGGAGVGKSLVIKTLYQTLFRILNSSPVSNPDDPKILLCAPTGKASFNIGGQAIHSAFKLPLNQKPLNELSASISNTLSTKLHGLKVLIIDEISMVGQHTFDMIDQRLRHIMGLDKPFGGVSVITVGDFFQLKPVCARPLFYPLATNPYAEIFGLPTDKNYASRQF